MTVSPDSPTSVPSPRRPTGRRRKEFGGHVATTIATLQRDYMKKLSGTVAAMAQLRAAVGREPGSLYSVLDVTCVPEKYLENWLDDDPTAREHAKHTALTLYALHQQSNYEKPMHRDDVGLGTAISQLMKTADSPEAVRRRFATLGTATTYDESVYHLRGLVQQLRTAKVCLDYGLLAEDLASLRWPTGRERVTAQWGREFYRNLSPTAPSGDSGAPETETTEE